MRKEQKMPVRSLSFFAYHSNFSKIDFLSRHVVNSQTLLLKMENWRTLKFSIFRALEYDASFVIPVIFYFFFLIKHYMNTTIFLNFAH